MAKLVGTNVGAPLVPGYSEDTYATHSEEYGKGGYRAVQTIAERDAISYERRSIGMEVRVMTGEEAGVYYLESFDGDDLDGVTSQSWVKVTADVADDDNGGAKEVYAGHFEDGSFFLESEDGSSLVPVDGIKGVLYLDLSTGYTYHYNEDSKAFEKINTLSWTEV